MACGRGSGGGCPQDIFPLYAGKRNVSHCHYFVGGKVLTPSAYKASKGVGVARVSENPYCWEPSAVAAILENVAYIGCTESFKSTRLGFKSKKRIPTAKEMRAYIENAHTPIIDREVWDKVQMIRENKRRPTNQRVI